jgi:opacity protein-like surface antigen
LLWGAFLETAAGGIYLGIQVPFNVIGGDFDGTRGPDVDPGLGAGIILGYGITPAFAVEIDWSAGTHNAAEGADFGFLELSLNGKLRLQSSGSVRPFLMAGIGTFALGDESLTYGGEGYNLGAGADFAVSPHASWGIAVMRKIITYDEITRSDRPRTLAGTLNGDTTSIRFDVTYHF